jgi:hypothetical protein
MNCLHCSEHKAAAEAFDNERIYYKDTVDVCVASMQRYKKLRQRDRSLLGDAMDELAATKKELQLMKEEAMKLDFELLEMKRQLAALRPKETRTTSQHWCVKKVPKTVSDC